MADSLSGTRFPTTRDVNVTVTTLHPPLHNTELPFTQIANLQIIDVQKLQTNKLAQSHLLRLALDVLEFKHKRTQSHSFMLKG